MFQGCKGLKSIDLSGFDTSGVTNMYYMFDSCSSLVSVDISGFDMTNVEPGPMDDPGYDEDEAIDLDIDTPVNPIDCNLFNGCKSLARVKVGKKSAGFGALPSYKVSGTKKWFSVKARKWFAGEQIFNSRQGIADVYVKSNNLAKAKVTGLATKSFTGKKAKQVPLVKFQGVKLKVGRDYTLTYKNNKNAGKATVIVNGRGAFAGSKTATFKIKKASNPLKASAKTVKVSAAQLAKKGLVTVKASKAFKVKGAKGVVTYKAAKRSAAGKHIAVTKAGKVVVKGEVAKGLYWLKVAVTAVGGRNYTAATRTVLLKVCVK